MIINARIQDLLMLLWRKKWFILFVTVLVGAISFPVAYAQYEYNNYHYNRIIEQGENDEEDKEENDNEEDDDAPVFFITTAYVAISDDVSKNQPPIQELVQIIQSGQVKNRAIQKMIESMEQTDEAEFIDDLRIAPFASFGVIQFQSNTLMEADLLPYVGFLMQETQKEISPHYRFSWTANYNIYTQSKEAVDQSEPEFMRLPEKPNAYIRIIGTALVGGFALTSFLILATDFIKPSIKGEIDAKNNLSYPIVCVSDIQGWLNGYKAIFYPVSRTKKHKTFLELRNAVTDSNREAIALVCVRNYITTYEDTINVIKSVQNEENIAIVLL